MGTSIQSVRYLACHYLAVLCCGYYLVACGAADAAGVKVSRTVIQRPDFPPYTVSPELQSYVDTYQMPNSISVLLSDELPLELAGKCEYWQQDHTRRQYKRILINRKVWNAYADIQRLALIHHELNHCVRGMEHDEGVLPNGCPDNIMYPSIPSESCLLDGGTQFI